MQDLVDHWEAEEEYDGAGGKWNKVWSNVGNTGQNLNSIVIDSDKVKYFIDWQEQNGGWEEDFEAWVGLELCNKFVNEHVEECAELKQINAVPEVFDVLHSVLFHLNDLEDEQEALSDKAKNIAEVLEQMSIREHDWEDEWNEEATDVESDDQVQELFSLHELEVNQLLHGLQFVEGKLVFVFFVKDAGQMLIIEIYVLEAFLVSSDLLTNDKFLEVDQTVLNLECLFLHVNSLLILKAFNAPCHVWILEDDLKQELLFSIMVVDEILHDMVAHSISWEWWQLSIVNEVLEIAELGINAVWITVEILLIINDLLVFIMISLKEWVDSFDQFSI